MWARDRARALRLDSRALAEDPLPHPDRRRDAAGPAARGQHHPRRAAGLRRGLRRHPVAAHQRLRRGAGAADRALGADRAAHPAGARPRVGRRRHRRPVRRLLLRRVADRRDRAALLGADRRASRSSAARSRRSTSSSARSRSRPLSYHERYRAGQDIVVGVNKYVTDTVDDVDILKVDPESERRQLERLAAFKANRDQAGGRREARGAARGRPRRGQPAAPDPRGARAPAPRSARSAARCATSSASTRAARSSSATARFALQDDRSGQESIAPG